MMKALELGDKIINPSYLKLRNENPQDEEERPSAYEIRKMRKRFVNGVLCAEYYKPLPSNIEEYLSGRGEVAKKTAKQFKMNKKLEIDLQM